MLSATNAGKEDLPLIHDLAYEIWPDAYGAILSPEQLSYMLDKMYSVPSLEKQLAELLHLFIIVKDNNVPKGFASFSLNPGSSSVFRLHKIYVSPDQQGKGTGRFLLEHIVNRIKKLGATSLRLNVNRHNKARFFYEKLGFRVIGEEDIDIGEGFFMNDYVMELAFKQ